MTINRYIDNYFLSLFCAIPLTILIGSAVYYIEKRREYKKEFKLFKFIFGVKNCKGYTPKWARIF